MERNLSTAATIAKLAALLSFSILCVTGAYSISRVDANLDRLLVSASNTVEAANRQIPAVASIAQDVHGTSQAANAAIADVRADLPPLVKQATADLQESHNLILEASLTAMEARKASAEERAALPALTAKTEATIDSLTKEFTALENVTKHADALVSDPHIKDALDHTDSTMTHVDAVTSDLQYEADKLVHPPKKKLGFWGGVWAVVQVVHKFEPPLF